MMIEAGDVESVSMRAIASEVGVTPPAIYAHFTDKDALFEGICDRRFGQLNATFREAIAGSEDALERLMLCGRAYVHFGIENPEAYRFLMMTRSEEDFDESSGKHVEGQNAFMTLVALVTDCIERGYIKRMDPLDASLIIWAQVHGLTTLMITNPKFEWADGIVDKMMDACMQGMAPR